MNISSYTDEQLLNLVNNSILKNTEFKVEDFSGGSISVTSVHKNTRQNYKVNLYFGYKGKNPINRSFDVKEDFYFIWCKAILLKVKSIETEHLGADFNELNELMKCSSTVVSKEVVSSSVVSTTPKDTLKGSIEDKLAEYDNINIDAFYEWVEHKKYKSIAPVTKLLNMFTKHSIQAQQDMVDKAIMNGWKGLVEPTQTQQKQQPMSFKEQDNAKQNHMLETFFTARDNGFDLRNISSENDVQDCEVIGYE